MNCSFDKERLALLLMDTTPEQERAEIESHLAGCADCRMELKAYKKVWTLMEETPQPVPPAAIAEGFTAMLTDFKAAAEREKKSSPAWLSAIANFFKLQPRPHFAYSLLLLFVGLSAGWLLRRPSPQSSVTYKTRIDSLSSQVWEMKQLMMLSMLENPSASQRIQAVGYTDEIGTVNRKVIDALLTTLNEDPNVNVRLMTLEALAKLSANPVVREGLVKSIIGQESPLVQSAIADTMVKLQEKNSVESLKKLLHKKDLNEMVRQKIEQSIHKLI